MPYHIKPFQIFFDKPTYAALKEMAKGCDLNYTDTVLYTVRLGYMLKDQKLLTEEGRTRLRSLLNSFKKPVGLEAIDPYAKD